MPSLTFPLPFLQGKFLVVMTSTGMLFSQPLIPACNAMEGPIYFTIDLPVSHPSIEVCVCVCVGGWVAATTTATYLASFSTSISQSH